MAVASSVMKFINKKASGSLSVRFVNQPCRSKESTSSSMSKIVDFLGRRGRTFSNPHTKNLLLQQRGISNVVKISHSATV